MRVAPSFKNRFPTFIYPFLFTTFSVVFYFSYDLHKTILVFAQALLYSLLLCLAIGTSFKLLFRDTAKASFATFIAVFAFFSYGHVHDYLIHVFAGHPPPVHHALGYAFMAVMVLCCAALFYVRSLPASFTLFLTASLSCMLFFSVLTAIKHTVDDKNGTAFNPIALTQLSTAEPKPDIYYIVFDDYAGNAALKNVYGFDNGSFLEQLRARGFYVADASSSNYNGSLHSLTSSLNMNYLDTLARSKPASESATSFYQKTIESNQVIQDLKNIGYHYYQLGSWFQYTRYNNNADSNMTPDSKPSFFPPYLSLFFLDTTLFQIIEGTFFPAIHKQYATYELDQTPKIASNGLSPKIVFSHILVPHGPIIYKGNCSDGDSGYLEQLKCSNQKILNLIDDIQRQSPTPPVIVLQSDEGPDDNSSRESSGNWSSIAIQEKFPILSAYYFPTKNYAGLYKGITPVNSFRVVFNTFLGGHLPLLPDKNYVLPDYTQINDPTDITLKVQALTP
jgi:hypothetical protein